MLRPWFEPWKRVVTVFVVIIIIVIVIVIVMIVKTLERHVQVL